MKSCGDICVYRPKTYKFKTPIPFLTVGGHLSILMLFELFLKVWSHLNWISYRCYDKYFGVGISGPWYLYLIMISLFLTPLTPTFSLASEMIFQSIHFFHPLPFIGHTLKSGMGGNGLSFKCIFVGTLWYIGQQFWKWEVICWTWLKLNCKFVGTIVYIDQQLWNSKSNG